MVENEYQQTSEYEDMANYKKTGEVGGIREISLRLFNNAFAEGSKEMTEAGIIKKVLNGEVIEIMRPNQREVYINSVKMLQICLLPRIGILPEDNEISKLFKEVNSDIEKLNSTREKAFEGVREESKKLSNPFRRPDKYNDEVTKQNQRVSEIIKGCEHANKDLHDTLLLACSYMLMHLNYFESKGKNV